MFCPNRPNLFCYHYARVIMSFQPFIWERWGQEGTWDSGRENVTPRITRREKVLDGILPRPSPAPPREIAETLPRTPLQEVVAC
jgi:hypothetical protein